MLTRIAALCGTVLAAGAAELQTEREAPFHAARTNIIFILTDDQGYGELGCQPHAKDAVRTPNIDRLAAEGVRFTQAYSNAHVCSPSRAAALTGTYAQRFGFEGNVEAGDGIPTDMVLMPRYFKEAGYATACIGKWHLGWSADRHPMRFGFDEFFGFLGGAHNYFDASAGQAGLGGDTHDIGPILDGEKPVASIDYLTKDFTDRAIDFVSRHANEPFCLYLAYNALHGPLHVPDEYRQQAGKRPSKFDKRRAMLTALDDNIGRLLEHLTRLDLDSRTLVVYWSDNGGTADADNWKLRGFKGHFFEAGIRVPAIMRWPGALPAGKMFDAPVMLMDVLPTCLAAGNIQADRAFDGVNLLPFLKEDRDRPPHEVLHWHMGKRFAVRRGDWKYVRDRLGEGLFDLATDVAESTDLREKHPDIARELLELHAAWERTLPARRGVEPKDGNESALD